MPPEPDALDIVHNEDKHRFEVHLDDGRAQVDYIRTPNGRIVYTHTEVPPSMEGRGIGSQLAAHVLDYAREHDLVVVPLCPFIAAYIRRHEDYRDLVLPGYIL